jgi:hypothetical protein
MDTNKPDPPRPVFCDSIEEQVWLETALAIRRENQCYTTPFAELVDSLVQLRVGKHATAQNIAITINEYQQNSCDMESAVLYFAKLNPERIREIAAPGPEHENGVRA